MASDAPSTPKPGVRPVAVLDYDGTCISGQSGKLLATWLLRKGLLSPASTCGLALWGARYKLHLPHRQNQARELIFRDLCRRAPHDVDQLMVEFHQEVLLPLYRPRALAEIAQRETEGCATVVVSATFYDIAREAARHLGTSGFVATRMERDANGNYTGRVEGEVVAGPAKIRAVRAWANQTLGEGAWALKYGYGDHHSDAELLRAVENPVAVCPGPTLRKVARKSGWPIQNWDEA